MGFLKNIKLNYNTKLLNESIKSKDFSNFENYFMDIKKSDLGLANKYIKYNANEFIQNEELEFLFNKDIIWTNSFLKDDADFASRIICEILGKISNYRPEQYDFYEETLLHLGKEELKDYDTFTNIFLKSHYYFQYLINQNKPGLKILKTRSAFFEYENTIHFTHPNLTRCFFYITKHPYRVYNDLKLLGNNQNQAMNILCALDDRPEVIKIKDNNIERQCPELRKSWPVNVSSWTNYNVQSSLRGLIISYEDLINNTEDKLMEISAHLKESGLDINLNPKDMVELAIVYKRNFSLKPLDKISNKEKKIIDRECGELIEEYYKNTY